VVVEVDVALPVVVLVEVEVDVALPVVEVDVLEEVDAGTTTPDPS